MRVAACSHAGAFALRFFCSMSFRRTAPASDPAPAATLATAPVRAMDERAASSVTTHGRHDGSP
ncbi:putative lipoprotein [Burkholderia thailandensis]|nr:putative lipoprotein [Burkholderia thailandensis]